jgi:hypothetical protein
MKPPECIGCFLDPLAPFGVSSVVQSLLHDLSVGPRMGDSDIPDVDPAILAVFPKLVIVEVGTQVCDDAVG